MRDNYHNYQLLLAKAAQLYERHGVERPVPFNVFSSLQNKNGYLNETLHSRFLYALLDYKKSENETRENLKDFLQHVDIENFELCGIKVEPECDDIDILIINAAKKAVVIENKSNPERGDEDKQLCRYYSTLKDQGYSDIHLLYLTPDGHDPSDNSVGNLDRKLIKLISYEKLIPWLERCQKRAYDEPELRESVAQYLQLVRRLTRTDYRGKYMDALKELCLQDKNLDLIRHLHDAGNEAVSELRCKLWNEINSELELLESEIPELRQLLRPVPKDKSDVRRYYQLSEASSLEIGEEEGCIWFGVDCSKEKDRNPYVMLERGLKHLRGEKNEWDYPWWRYADQNLNLCDPTPENLKLLLSIKKRKEFVKKIVQDVKEVLEVLEDIALVNAIKEGEKTGLASREEIFKILKGIEC